MARKVTNIVVAEDGTESHESWLSIGASKVQSSGSRACGDTSSRRRIGGPTIFYATSGHVDRGIFDGARFDANIDEIIEVKEMSE